ncbi:hypothetical protein C1O28_07845 [Rathayibacter rathayi]|nr:hypothetical protein C1O28_07845 [Rathayibacter rathayi]
MRALGMRATAPVQVRTSAGPVTGDRAYLLTGAPILDRGLYLAKRAALRSSAIAFHTDAVIPDGMYLSVDEPSRSVRDAESEGERRLLVGGNGHPVGRRPVTSEAVEDLIAWTRRSFPGAEPVAQWSAHDSLPPRTVRRLAAAPLRALRRLLDHPGSRTTLVE